MRPADERLAADHASVIDLDDRLVVEHHLAALDRPLELPAQLESVKHPLMHPGFEHADGALARLLRGVHGGVGVAEDLVDADRAVADGHADRGANPQLTIANVDRGCELLEQPSRDPFAIPVAVGQLEEDGELVTTEPSRGVRDPRDIRRSGCRPRAGARRRSNGRGCR